MKYKTQDSPLDRHIRESIKKDPEYAEAFFEGLSDEPLHVQITLLRRVYGISQEEVASQLHVKQSQISRLEKKNSDHLLSTYQKLAKIFHSKILVVPDNYKVVPG